jgi:hypothetical protein
VLVTARLGRTIAQAVIVTCFSKWWCRFAPGSVHVGFMVGKMSVGESLSPSGFLLSISFHLCLISIHVLCTSGPLAVAVAQRHKSYPTVAKTVGLLFVT